MTLTLRMIGRPGPSLPISIRNYSRSTITGGRADPIWDIKHETKFSRKPKEDAPLVVPRGSLPTLEKFLERAEEIAWLAKTQHLELATTRATLLANGIGSIDINGEEAPDISEGDTASAPYYLDPALERRIDWERFMFACGPVHRSFFNPTKQGTTGIAYDGPEKKNIDFITNLKRRVKQAWLATHETLPTPEEIIDNQNYISFYGNTTPLHPIVDGWQDEDPDPHREEFVAQEGKRHNDTGYAGPVGSLGLDMEDEPEPGEEPEY